MGYLDCVKEGDTILGYGPSSGTPRNSGVINICFAWRNHLYYFFSSFMYFCATTSLSDSKVPQAAHV